MMRSHSWIMIAALLAASVLAAGCMPYSTGTTEVGVRTKLFTLFGEKGVQKEIYEPGGTYFFVPFINDWHTFDMQLENLEMTAAVARGDRPGRDDLLFKTIDGNDIGLDVIISYRLIPEKAPEVLQYVASNSEELKNNIVRAIARSKPRDIFGELDTEQFYLAEERDKKAADVEERLNEILEPFGVVVERVSPRDYRFSPEYQKAIEDKKVADQLAEKLKSETNAVEEEYRTKVEEARAGVEKVQARADGEYERAKIEADAYFEQETQVAKAIEAEAIAEAEGLRQLHAALAGAGGERLVNLAVAGALKDKRIIMLPEGGLDVRSTNVNELLQLYGIKAAGEGGAPVKDK
ncbi:MAG: SPFH domain-containing protein [Candidatus Hydrogenedentota bacterium]